MGNPGSEAFLEAPIRPKNLFSLDREGYMNLLPAESKGHEDVLDKEEDAPQRSCSRRTGCDQGDPPEVDDFLVAERLLPNQAGLPSCRFHSCTWRV